LAALSCTRSFTLTSIKTLGDVCYKSVNGD
jgi:hypothetical protein